MRRDLCLRALCLSLLAAWICILCAGCGNNSDTLADGTYTVVFSTDSSMFHVNEVCHGTAVLTVDRGRMSVHITMPSKNIVNLFSGTAEDARKDGALLIEPTLDPVTYDDGTGEEVFGFDLPVPYLDREFPCAILGTKGKWYDHMVMVSGPTTAP